MQYEVFIMSLKGLLLLVFAEKPKKKIIFGQTETISACIDRTQNKNGDIIEQAFILYRYILDYKCV